MLTQRIPPPPRSPAATPGVAPGRSIAQEHSEMYSVIVHALALIRSGRVHQAEDFLDGCIAEIDGNAP